MCFGGCSFFSCNEDSEEKNAYAFAIQYDDELTKYSFNSEKSIKVSPRHKEGYVLEGFYTVYGGGGTKMLDWDGTCLSSSFSGDGSTVLYPYYKTINMSYEFITPTYYYEDPKTNSSNIYGNPKIYSLSLLHREGFEYFQRVAKGNPEMEVRIAAYAELSGGEGTFGVGVGDENASKANISETVPYSSYSSTYQDVYVATVVKCKAFNVSDPNVIIGVKCSSAKNTYLKNLKFKITFVKYQ